jgi:hypothetical protein
MVDCCANPSCRKEFRFLNGGDLYALERESANTQFFWICSRCSRSLVLELGSDGSVSARFRRQTTDTPHPPRHDGYLKLVYKQSRTASNSDENEDPALFSPDRAETERPSQSIHTR